MIQSFTHFHLETIRFPLPFTFLTLVTELYSLDERAAYTHAFVYIRQLAVHLRDALAQPKKDTLTKLYSWQFLQSLRCEFFVLDLAAPCLSMVVVPSFYRNVSCD